jgi:SH3-like domain-containing protein
VTIDADKAYVRSGPAPRYPVKLVYKKAGLPVEIIQEFDVWRKVRDIDGDGGWINKALLSDKRSVIIKSSEAIEMREGFSQNSRVIAKLENGVLGRLLKCTETWCQVSSGGYQGWVQRNFLWGLYPKEEIH